MCSAVCVLTVLPVYGLPITCSSSALMPAASARLAASCSMACSSATASLAPLVTVEQCKEWGSSRLSSRRNGPTLSRSVGPDTSGARRKKLNFSLQGGLHMAWPLNSIASVQPKMFTCKAPVKQSKHNAVHSRIGMGCHQYACIDVSMALHLL